MLVLLRILQRLGCLVPVRDWRRAKLLAADRQGNALLEAALVFPILAGLFVGVSEFSEAFIVSRRLGAIATEGTGTVVTFHYGEGKKVPVPEELRERIRILEGHP